MAMDNDSASADADAPEVKVVGIRFPKTMLADVEAAMAAEGFSNVSEWIRVQAFRAARRILDSQPDPVAPRS